MAEKKTTVPFEVFALSLAISRIFLVLPAPFSPQMSLINEVYLLFFNIVPNIILISRGFAQILNLF